jgi:hypothetical protein
VLKSQSFLRCHVVYCKWWVTIRNVWSIYRLPLPLMVGGVHDAWNEGMAIATEAYSEMLSACIKESWKLGSLPHAIGNAVVLSYAAVSMGITHFRQIHSGEPLPSSLDIPSVLADIEVLLATSVSELSGLLRRTRDRLMEYPSQLVPREAVIEKQARWDAWCKTKTGVSRR